MDYRLVPGDSAVERLQDGAIIPRDPANADWRRYQAWLSAGNVPMPAPAAPATPPASVPRWRARAALRMAGLLPAVEQAIASADIATQEWWAAGLEMERAHPRVAQLATALGLSAEQVDNLFLEAAGL